MCISHREMLYIANEGENNLLCSEEQQFTAALSRIIASYILSKQQRLSALFRGQLCRMFGFTYLSFGNSNILIHQFQHHRTEKRGLQAAIIEINSIKNTFTGQFTALHSAIKTSRNFQCPFHRIFKKLCCVCNLCEY